MDKKQKVVVGLSGGVDSSVSAYLLQKQGYEVAGVYMKLHNAIDGYHEKNIAAGKKVAQFLNIEYEVLDLSKQFEQEVYDYFVQGYLDGITPNPCVKCNRTIKFGALYDYAISKNADFLATGHYAKTDGEFIYCAHDKTKDQSYFLGQIDKKVLPKLMFPMSTYTKEEIRKIGESLPALKQIAQQKDSQEICFVEKEYTDILQKHTNIDRPGITLDKQGKEVGHHKGYMHYTIGKRRGFYVHGAHEPHFVLSSDAHNNTITVGKKEDLAIECVEINNLNMFIDEREFFCGVKLRYRSAMIPCHVVVQGKTAQIKLLENAYGVAKGQVAVFYDGEKVLGSGWITLAQ
ncbi:MAG: tRNA 2-thiouridine(34) synthase MnmA [Campylobacterota bacterium]|nr:tRNA 2-thiouridine(34) synthase MnmA [Campylobacterota bacterium]